MARSRFENPDWHAALAGILLEEEGERIAARLIDAIDQVVVHDGACLLAFHADAPPEVLQHNLAPDVERHYLERYLAGPYLLDPLYELALSDEKPATCRFRDATPDRFHSSEYYRHYCERTHLKDEMDFLVDVGKDSALALVVGRRGKMFSKAEFSRLQLFAPIVRAAMQRIWRSWRTQPARDEPDRAIHKRLTECFKNFGDGLLTERELEITQLLLRGHSTKSVARKLDIAPGTVMVHKRNLFSKLGITSQYELFSRFIDDLSR
jgi:DNA-binding CsgD family transcriptional regulator